MLLTLQVSETQRSRPDKVTQLSLESSDPEVSNHSQPQTTGNGPARPSQKRETAGVPWEGVAWLGSLTQDSRHAFLGSCDLGRGSFLSWAPG